MTKGRVRRMIYNALSRFSPRSLLVQRLFGSDYSVTGIEINEYNAMKYSAVWSAVNIISSTVGFLPLKIYRRTGNESRIRADEHPVYVLLHSRPNPYMSAQVLKETLTAHALIWGNGYAEIQRDRNGYPVALWPLLPNTTRCIYDSAKQEFYYEISEYNGGIVRLDYNQVLHIHGLGFDGLTGYSVIDYANNSLGISMAAERNAGTFFKNDSSPRGALITDLTLNKETKEGVESDWERKHGGLDNRYRIAVLHSGLKYQSFGIPAKDAQLLESRKFGITEVARWFQIPPHMIGDLDRATFSNIEHQGIQFITMTLQRWLEYWKHEADYKLIPPNERSVYFVDFVVDMLLRGDSVTRAKVYQIALGGNNNPGYMTPNEVRQRENLPPNEDGDRLFLPEYGNGSEGNQGYQDLFKGIWNRVVTKEVKAIRKALKKPEKFIDWVDSFYAEHAAFIQNLLQPVIKVYCGKEATLIDVSDYINERISTIKNAFNDNTINELLGEYETLEAQKQSQNLMTQLKGLQNGKD